jgi:hypothetical protein
MGIFPGLAPPGVCHITVASRSAALLGAHKQDARAVVIARQEVVCCFKSHGESIEFVAAIRTGLAERQRSFLLFSHHCFFLGVPIDEHQTRS